jgi:hypothetical protein
VPFRLSPFKLTANSIQTAIRATCVNARVQSAAFSRFAAGNSAKTRDPANILVTTAGQKNMS